MKAAIAVFIAIASARSPTENVPGTPGSDVTAWVAAMNGGDGELIDEKVPELTTEIKMFFELNDSLLFTQVEPANKPKQTKEIAEALVTDGVVVYQNQRKDSSALRTELKKLLNVENEKGGADPAWESKERKEVEDPKLNVRMYYTFVKVVNFCDRVGNEESKETPLKGELKKWEDEFNTLWGDRAIPDEFQAEDGWEEIKKIVPTKFTDSKEFKLIDENFKEMMESTKEENGSGWLYGLHNRLTYFYRDLIPEKCRNIIGSAFDTWGYGYLFVNKVKVEKLLGGEVEKILTATRTRTTVLKESKGEEGDVWNSVEQITVSFKYKDELKVCPVAFIKGTKALVVVGSHHKSKLDNKSIQAKEEQSLDRTAILRAPEMQKITEVIVIGAGDLNRLSNAYLDSAKKDAISAQNTEKIMNELKTWIEKAEKSNKKIRDQTPGMIESQDTLGDVDENPTPLGDYFKKVTGIKGNMRTDKLKAFVLGGAKSSIEDGQIHVSMEEMKGWDEEEQTDKDCKKWKVNTSFIDATKIRGIEQKSESEEYQERFDKFKKRWDEPKSELDAVELNRVRDASNEEEWDEVKSLVTNNPSILIQKDKSGQTALHYAAQRGNLEMVKFMVNEMVKEGWSISEKDNLYGGTPLHLAVMVEDVAIVQFLVDSGALISKEDTLGKTPLDYANDVDENVKLEIQNILRSAEGKTHHFREQDQNKRHMPLHLVLQA